ncbi:hypothetical protein SARC_03207 [Sphaeroforma arctica JP610]|uniref:Microtubule-associated protein n=1 Tax=Sphaeroforma arctica JP610 TaxID=667725 RepID=A0A0L0G8P1_9EUKA|nr:hypothetical protein SARC_03207 [Sphaeroforma arctica JP610]KNC84588.1 hypothetical protein SARC_03207 [Sphaeroforma arctica JP610]|eukprot:XP_014158490.1 hypothetical protein SARC_03207 [Sphaeroforma arctica JP610]
MSDEKVPQVQSQTVTTTDTQADVTPTKVPDMHVSKIPVHAHTEPKRRTNPSGLGTSYVRSPQRSPAGSNTTLDELELPRMDFSLKNFVPKSAAELYKETSERKKTDKYAHVKSRVGSFDNIGYKSGSMSTGKPKQKITSQRAHYENVQAKVSSHNKNFKPSEPKPLPDVPKKKLDFSHVRAKVGSLENVDHTPAQSKFKMPNTKLTFKESAKSRVGSLDNIDHVPGGGDKKIETQKLNYRHKDISAKVNSLPSSKKNSVENMSGSGKRSASASVVSKVSASDKGVPNFEVGPTDVDALTQGLQKLEVEEKAMSEPALHVSS